MKEQVSNLKSLESSKFFINLLQSTLGDKTCIGPRLTLMFMVFIPLSVKVHMFCYGNANVVFSSFIDNRHILLCKFKAYKIMV